MLEVHEKFAKFDSMLDNDTVCDKVGGARDLIV